MGRWLTKDPVKFDGSSTNLYTYVNGDPVNYVDATGENPILVAMLVGALGSAAFDIVLQLIRSGGNLACIDWDSVLRSAGIGAALGGASGLLAKLMGILRKFIKSLGAADDVLRGLAPKDADIYRRAGELIRGGDDALTALSKATRSVVPNGQVHRLGTLAGGEVFGSLVTGTGIVEIDGVLMIVQKVGDAFKIVGPLL